MSGQSTDGIDNLENPAKFSIGDRTVDISELPIRVTQLKVEPSHGNIWVYWESLQPDTNRSGGNQ